MPFISEVNKKQIKQLSHAGSTSSLCKVPTFLGPSHDDAALFSKYIEHGIVSRPYSTEKSDTDIQNWIDLEYLCMQKMKENLLFLGGSLSFDECDFLMG